MFKKSIIKKLMLLLFLVCLTTESTYACFFLNWRKYAGVAVGVDDVIVWVSTAGQVLYDDNSGPDVSVNIMPWFDFTCSTWECDDEGGTDYIQYISQLDDITDEMENENIDCVVVNYIEVYGTPADGVTRQSLQKILITWCAPSITFVHELGHCAGLYEIYTDSDRIMYYADTGSHDEVRTDCPVNGNEKTAFESLGSSM